MEYMEPILKYEPFQSFVHPSFWHSLSEMKLNVDKLDETTKQIFGKYSYRDDLDCFLEVDSTSFNSEYSEDHLYQPMYGTIMNKNTIEEFKNIDKTELLNSVGEKSMANIKSKAWVENPSLLSNFFILSFADLKKFHYYFWFAFPCPSQPIVHSTGYHKIMEGFSRDNLFKVLKEHKALQPIQKPFFAIDLETSDVITMAQVMVLLSSWKRSHQGFLTRVMFGFLDPSNKDYPGWIMRVFIVALVDLFPWILGKKMRILAMRYNCQGFMGDSKIYTVKVPENTQSSVDTGFVGWERNDKGKFGPKRTDMSASMDPIRLADASADLNLRLMKWRLLPELDVACMRRTRCLLLGSGTLGCHVARDLLAWGFRDITFVDNGKVSFSNPTRQILFYFEDCLKGGKGKAAAAAENLAEIVPYVNTKGIKLHIPMPGHPIGASMRNETVANIKRLTEAIESHDVIFLLLDTREARWLPTLLAAHFGKIVINAALGFDSYLVIRHGVHKDQPSLHEEDTGSTSEIKPEIAGSTSEIKPEIAGSTSEIKPEIAGSSSETKTVNKGYLDGGDLGCYFCNDVTAPGNSIKDRTLDQQCTVTRPGAAAIAAALAVELLVSVLQHPKRVEAPAIYNTTANIDSEDIPAHLQGILGTIPHSIRGFLHSYQTVTPTCEKFKQCIACSQNVVERYREDGVEFILKVCESGKYLEDVTGLADLQLAAEIIDILNFSDGDLSVSE